MKALVEKDILMKKQEKEMRKAPHFFYVHLSRELKGTQGNSRELKGTQGNSSSLKEALVEGKKLRKRVKEGKFQKSEKEKKRENIEALYERLKNYIRRHWIIFQTLNFAKQEELEQDEVACF